MEKAIILTISFFLLIIYCFGFPISSVDTLKPGDSLDSSSFLVSANNVFTLGFYKPMNFINNDSYLGIWYTNSTLHVWLLRGMKPITDDSGILSINSAGKLILTSNISDPIELYASGNGANITATLLNSGNFVVREMNINGSPGRILLESFDYPTDTLLPGMKLGVNHSSGTDWHLTSWFGEDNPSSGAFTLEWDPGTRMLIVRRRGLIYWTSGNLKDYTNQSLRLNVKEFENIPKPDFEDFNYNFTNVSNGVEDYFSYSLIKDPTFVWETISGWQLKYNGDIFDIFHGAMIAEPSCRNHNEIFVLKSGHFANGNGKEAVADFDDNYSLTESDCREKCWHDCECLGFEGGDGYGCTYWKGKILTFVQSYNGSEPKQFVLVLEASTEKSSNKTELPTKRWKSWKIITLVISVVALLLGCVWFIIRKIEQGKRKKEELRELMTLDEYTETHAIESNRGQGYHLRLFMYSSILGATGNFSSTNKLGEGGFGPVYKGKTVEGQEIAVKDLILPPQVIDWLLFIASLKYKLVLNNQSLKFHKLLATSQ
ncbi:Hypothetical predicted protein [Olea europaea subsp. europaea]|uniref:Bulb-type lectin domain-containing protein n=1 Tax=Olea europaea subsp. europaea TaxID=158383 RepID=A0A8S0RWG8_OLEEU|nr:Hypothetical predicted protein [Olea europaea subsp. europaea]